MAKVTIDYEERLYLALAAVRGAGFAPIRVVLDRPTRLGPTSIDWSNDSAARALDLEVAFDPDQPPHILVEKDQRTFQAPIRTHLLARWLASDAGEREPLALIPSYRQARLRAVG
jgi:hypothetical protein